MQYWSAEMGTGMTVTHWREAEVVPLPEDES